MAITVASGIVAALDQDGEEAGDLLARLQERGRHQVGAGLLKGRDERIDAGPLGRGGF
jgi:hypothetical protein